MTMATYFLKVLLPRELGPVLERVQEDDPRLLSEVVGATISRWALLQELEEAEGSVLEEMRRAVFSDEERAILEAHGLGRILELADQEVPDAENP